MIRRAQIQRRVLAATALAGAAVVGFAPAAHAQGSGSPSQLVGYNLTAEAIGVQFAFNIPGIVPLPNENLLEDDVPFSRTLVSGGPLVQAIGTPYYPGDILANLGGLESEFLPPQIPNINYPGMARADYPADSAYGTSATFGASFPAGLPLLPSVATGTANASANGGTANGTISDVVVGPGLGQGGAPLLEVGSNQSNTSVTLGTSTVTSTASAVIKTIDVAGMLDISGIDSQANSTSDGNTGTPVASLQIGQVTVDGEPAYIDNQGVHVVGTNPAPAGTPTAAQLQSSLDQTLAQDGISISLLEPEQTVNGADGTANAGGLVISITHSFDVPFLNLGALTGNLLQPCIPTQDVGELPIPGLEGQTLLGNVCLPSGNYTAITSITLGMAMTDANASVLQQISVPTLPITLSTPGGLGSLSSTGPTNLTGVTSPGTVTGPGAPTAPQALGGGLSKFPLRGVPAPLGWVILGIVLCVIFAYPMMLAARWQFLVGRR